VYSFCIALKFVRKNDGSMRCCSLNYLLFETHMTHCVSSSALREADEAESSSTMAESDARVVASSVVSRPREATFAAAAPRAWAAALRMICEKTRTRPVKSVPVLACGIYSENYKTGTTNTCIQANERNELRSQRVVDSVVHC